MRNFWIGLVFLFVFGCVSDYGVSVGLLDDKDREVYSGYWTEAFIGDGLVLFEVPEGETSELEERLGGKMRARAGGLRGNGFLREYEGRAYIAIDLDNPEDVLDALSGAGVNIRFLGQAETNGPSVFDVFRK